VLHRIIFSKLASGRSFAVCQVKKAVSTRKIATSTGGSEHESLDEPFLLPRDGIVDRCHLSVLPLPEHRFSHSHRSIGHLRGRERG